MKHLVMLLLALCVPAHAACLWSDPGAHRFTGDPVEAVRSYGDIPPKAREALAEAVRLKAYSAIVEIRRESIDGGRFTGMRAMFWGEGHQCLGDVDRSAWAPDRVERGLVFCERGHCIIIPTVCGNVARVNMAGVRPLPDIEPAGRGLQGRLVAPSGAQAVRTVPEPGSLALVIVALIAAAVVRRRSR